MKSFTSVSTSVPEDAVLTEQKYFLNNGSDFLSEEYATKEDAISDAQHLTANHFEQYGKEIFPILIKELYSPSLDEYFHVEVK